MIRPVFRFLEELDRETALRASSPSLLGSQLERMRDGTMEIDFRNPFAQEARTHKHTLRILIWNSLPKIARIALALKSEPVSWNYRFRTVPESDLVADHNFDPPVLTTRNGEELALEREQQFPPEMGYRVVCSPKPIFRKNADIAEMLLVSERHLRTILQKAYAQIENHPLFPEVFP